MKRKQRKKRNKENQIKRIKGNIYKRKYKREK